MDLTTGELEKIDYEPLLNPRYSSAITVVGDELYILGGRGNKYGKQELVSHFYTELCAIDLKKKKSRVVWRRQQTDAYMLMASSMYFEPSDSSFYAVALKDGGVLWKVSMKDTVWTEVSKPIHNDVVHQDCDFSFYSSPSHQKLFLVMDKILTDRTHDVSIYSINTPLMSESDIMQVEEEVVADSFAWYWIVVGILALLGLGYVIYFWLSRNKAVKSLSENVSTVMGDMPEGSKKQENRGTELEGENILVAKPIENYFDRSRSAIFLKIRWNENVFCDYCTALHCMDLLQKNGAQKDEVLLNQILELLLYGPLLSNTIVDWLDEFKDAYSSLSIDLLRNLLDIEYRKSDREMVLRITDIMFLHDPLNEEALAAKCSVLFLEGKKGIAKSVYDRFCKEYRESLGEDYKIPLSKLCE